MKTFLLIAFASACAAQEVLNRTPIQITEQVYSVETPDVTGKLYKWAVLTVPIDMLGDLGRRATYSYPSPEPSIGAYNYHSALEAFTKLYTYKSTGDILRKVVTQKNTVIILFPFEHFAKYHHYNPDGTNTRLVLKQLLNKVEGVPGPSFFVFVPRGLIFQHLDVDNKVRLVPGFSPPVIPPVVPPVVPNPYFM